ncbi:MAG: hypothetical protein WDN45_09470 [Caulobacteraceae bacterium]
MDEFQRRVRPGRRARSSPAWACSSSRRASSICRSPAWPRAGAIPPGSFSGYAAGIGILYVQAVLVRSLQRDPEVRSKIETAA